MTFNVASGWNIGSQWAIQSYTVPYVTTLNALLYLDAGNTSSYSGSGTTWTDLSSNINNATLTGTPTFTNSGAASYFSFDGTGNQYALTVSSEYNTTYTGKTTFFAARMNNAFGTSRYRALFGSLSGTRNFNTYIYSPTSGVYQIHGSFGGGSSLSNNLSLTTNQWFTCGITQDNSGNMTHYFNGQQTDFDTGQALAQWASNGGEAVAASDNYWYGDISVIAIYSRALSAAEMSLNHLAVSTRYGI
jgi:hypothetical protein